MIALTNNFTDGFILNKNQSLYQMKIFCKTILIVLSLLMSMNEIQAQTKQAPLDQVALMKQFIGTWECELGKDTMLVTTNKPFGSGMECNGQVVTKGKILDSIKQLFGYDKITDRFMMAELIESSPVMEICSTWFTSGNTGEIVLLRDIPDPGKAGLRYEFEFKSPGMIVQTALKNGKVFKVVTLRRIKSKN